MSRAGTTVNTTEPKNCEGGPTSQSTSRKNGMSTGTPLTGLCAIIDVQFEAAAGGPISHTESYCVSEF